MSRVLIVTQSFMALKHWLADGRYVVLFNKRLLSRSVLLIYSTCGDVVYKYDRISLQPQNKQVHFLSLSPSLSLSLIRRCFIVGWCDL